MSTIRAMPESEDGFEADRNSDRRRLKGQGRSDEKSLTKEGASREKARKEALSLVEADLAWLRSMNYDDFKAAVAAETTGQISPFAGPLAGQSGEEDEGDMWSETDEAAGFWNHPFLRFLASL